MDKTYRSPFGIMRRSLFAEAEISIFKVSPPDVFHDIPEGVLSGILDLILSKSGIKISTLNESIKGLKWVNGPVFIDRKFKVLGKAYQKLEFFTRLVEILNSWLLSNNDFVSLYFSFKHIVFMTFGNSTSDEETFKKEIEYFIEVFLFVF